MIFLVMSPMECFFSVFISNVVVNACFVIWRLLLNHYLNYFLYNYEYCVIFMDVNLQSYIYYICTILP